MKIRFFCIIYMYYLYVRCDPILIFIIQKAWKKAKQARTEEEWYNVVVVFFFALLSFSTITHIYIKPSSIYFKQEARWIIWKEKEFVSEIIICSICNVIVRLFLFHLNCVLLLADIRYCFKRYTKFVMKWMWICELWRMHVPSLVYPLGLLVVVAKK